MTDLTSVAEEIAQAILQHSYSKGDEYVYDLLLFGSTATGIRYKQKEHDARPDLDILVIHQLPGLLRFGYFTVYDPKKGRCEFDPNADITSRRYSSEVILNAMGTPNIADLDAAYNEIFETVHQQRLFDLASDHSELFDDFNEETQPTPLRSVQLPYINVEFSLEEEAKVLYDKLDQIVKEHIRAYSARHHVELVLKKHGLTLDSLDLLVMHKTLFTQTQEGTELRGHTLTQSRDPAFWYDILGNGKLYNPETGKFDMSFDQKYPGVRELFRLHQTL
jgi:predicted nucleotidyltransferase